MIVWSILFPCLPVSTILNKNSIYISVRLETPYCARFGGCTHVDRSLMMISDSGMELFLCQPLQWVERGNPSKHFVLSISGLVVWIERSHCRVSLRYSLRLSGTPHVEWRRQCVRCDRWSFGTLWSVVSGCGYTCHCNTTCLLTAYEWAQSDQSDCDVSQSWSSWFVPTRVNLWFDLRWTMGTFKGAARRI